MITKEVFLADRKAHKFTDIIALRTFLLSSGLLDSGSINDIKTGNVVVNTYTSGSDVVFNTLTIPIDKLMF